MTSGVIASRREGVDGPAVIEGQEVRMTVSGVAMRRLALAADAAACGAMGLALAGWSGALGAVFGLPAGLLLAVGLGLLPWAAWLGRLAAQAAPGRGAVRVVVAVNAVWVADSVALVLLAPALGWAMTALGVGFVLAQAAACGVVAMVLGMGLRRRVVVA
jgi:hypothetical protein